MTRCTTAAVVLGCLLVGQTSAIDLEFDYSLDTYQFNDGTVGFFNKFPEAKTDLEKAARVFERFQDSLARIEPSSTIDPQDVEGGPYDVWAGLITHPGTGQNGYRLPGLTIEADTVRIYAGGRDIAGTTLGLGGRGGTSTFPTTDFAMTVKTRGQGTLEEVTGPDAVEIAPWGGSIAFDTVETSGVERVWNFGSAPGSGDVDENDFLSVAIHELAHALGFSSSAPSFSASISEGAFTGDAAQYTYGGPVPLSPDQSHFAEGTLSEVDGVTQETAMDPSLRTFNGISDRKLFTDLDYAAMRDIGWTVPVIGDANVDGKVSISDLVLLAQNYGLQSDVDWPEGDFNLDGKVSISDLVLLAQHYGQTDPLNAPSAPAALSGAVPSPEPGSLMILGALAAGLIRRRPCEPRASAGGSHG